MSRPDRMTTAEVAEHLGVSRWTVSRQLGIDGADISTTAYVAWINAKVITPGAKDEPMDHLPDLPTLHLLDDVARRYGLSPRSLKDGARAKKFEHTRIGVRRYFTEPQLKAFLAARAVVPERDTSLDGMRARRERRKPQRQAQPAA